MFKKIVIVFFVVLLISFAFRPFLIKYIDQKYNPISQVNSSKIIAETTKLHKRLLIADLHADPLLWGRDLTKRHSYGHLDFPRMREGHLALQVFGLVSKSPKGQNFHSNSADSDRLTPLLIAQGWPISSWTSTLNRTLYQAQRLKDLAQLDGQFILIENLDDLNGWLHARQKNSRLLAGLLATEGAHPLEASLTNLRLLYKAGIRVIGLAHFFDNHFAGSAHGTNKGGLSQDGLLLVQQAQSMGMLIDLAHSSTTTIDMVLSVTKKPLLVSHTGVKGTCNSPRNLSDKHIKQIAQTGGVIGVAIFKGATCGDNIGAMLNALDHVKSLVAIEHIALGMDMDGAVTSPIDVSQLHLITQGLLKRGYNEQQIAQIMGLNVIRVLQETLIN